MPYETEYIPFAQGMNVGMGVNLVTGTATTQVFPNIPTTTKPYPNFVNPTKCIQTSDDYVSVLDTSAKIEGQAWTEEGKVSLNTSAAYLRKQHINAQTLTFVIYKGSTTVSEVPSSEAVAALKLPDGIGDRILSDPQGFLEHYGTHFIAGFVYGGSFIGTITIEAMSEQDMQRIKTTFSTEINEFGTGNAKIDGSFNDKVQSNQNTYQITADRNGIGVNPPKFDASSILQMQDYVDNQFVEELGTGVQIQAVCYPWEMLPCVMNLPGYQAGTLSPQIDTGVIKTLQNEYRRLEYAAETAMYMQANTVFVSQASAQTLQNDFNAVNEALGKIEELTFSDLQKLDQNSEQQYVVSTRYLDDLNQIARGRAEVDWTVQLDGAFTPNTQSDPGTVKTGAIVVFPTSDSTMNSVIQSNHGDGTLACGFIYQYVPVSTGKQPPSGLQNQVQLMASLKWNGKVSNGTPVTGSMAGEQSQNHWEKYEWDRIICGFGS